MDYGYTIFKKEGSEDLIVPFLLTGENESPTVPAGYTKYKSYPGTTVKHNLAPSKIAFTNDFFDRSDTDIWNDDSRASGDYDSAAPKNFHIDNINFKTLIGWLNIGYAGRLFPKVYSNSIIENDRERLDEILFTINDLTESNEEKALRYTGDISQAVTDDQGNVLFDDETNYVIISD
jgi:hypothetical protein